MSNLNYSTILVLTFLSLTILSLQSAHATSGSDSWYPGKGLKQGDYFSYNVCWTDWHNCSPLQMSFWVKNETSDGSGWNVVFMTVDGSNVQKGIMTIGKITPDPTSFDSNISDYTGVYRSTVSWLDSFATKDTPKTFNVPAWGRTGSVGGQSVGPLDQETITVGAGTFNTWAIGWHKCLDNKIWVDPSIAFPVKAIVYVDVATGSSSPDFTLELLKTGNSQTEPDVLKGPSTNTIVTSTQCDQPNMEQDSVHQVTTTDSSSMAVEYRYSPSNPHNGCPIEFRLSFEQNFDQSQKFSNLQYDIFIVDNNDQKLYSLAQDKGRTSLFAPVGDDDNTFVMKGTTPVTHFVIAALGTGPEGSLPDTISSGLVRVDVKTQSSFGSPSISAINHIGTTNVPVSPPPVSQPIPCTTTPTPSAGQPHSSSSNTNPVISIPPLPSQENAILANENNASALAAEGVSLVRFNAYLPSFYYCDKAVKLDPSNSMALQCKNNAYNTILPLISLLSKANDDLSKDPSNQTAIMFKVFALWNLGEFNELSSDEKNLLDKSMALQTTSNFNDLEMQFQYFLALGDYDKALATTDKLIGEFTGQEPEESEYLEFKAVTLYKEGKYDEALVLMDQAQQSNPSVNTNYIYDIEKGIIYEKMGKPDLASTYFDSITANDPPSSTNGKLDSLKGSFSMNFLFDYNTALNYFDKVQPSSPYYYETVVSKVVSSDRLTQSYVPSSTNSNLLTQTTSSSPQQSALTSAFTTTQQELRNHIYLEKPGYELAINEKTNTIYVTHQGDENSTSVIDGATNKVVQTIPVGLGPGFIAVNKATGMIYVTYGGPDHGGVSVIDGTTNKVVQTIPVGSFPMGVTINEKTNTIYIANQNGNSVSVIDGTTNKVVQTIPVGSFPDYVAVNEKTNRIYVPNSTALYVIDGTTNKVVQTIPVGLGLTYVAVNQATNLIYVTLSTATGPNLLAIIDGTTNKVVQIIPVGLAPWEIAVNEKTNTIYVANYHSDNISVVQFVSNAYRVINTIPTGVPDSIRVNSNTNTIYVLSMEDKTISVISEPPTNPVFTATQQDIQSINEAKASQTIAAEVNVGASQSTTTSIDNNVTIQTTTNTPDSLNVNVSAPSQTGPKVIAFNLNTKTVNVANLNQLSVMYDGKLIPPAPNMDAILHAKPTDSPSFAIIVTQSGVQVLVLVPHFSTHSITIMNMSKIMTPTVPEFPFAIPALIIATFSIVLIPKIKQIQKL